MARAARLSMICAAVSGFAWLALIVEAKVPVGTCSAARSTLESWLFFGKASGVFLPFVGLLLAGLGHRAGRSAATAAILNAIVVLYVAALFAGVLPAHRFPCLRS